MFQMAEETPTHYIIKHPKGDILKIAKSGLSNDMHEHIKKISTGSSTGEAKEIKGYADGTPDEPVQEPDVISDSEIKGRAGVAPQQAPVVVNVQAPTANPPAAQPAVAQAPAPAPTTDPAEAAATPQPGAPNGSVGQYQQGLRQEAQAQSQLGQEKAGAYGQQATDEAKYNTLLQQSLAEEHQHVAKTVDDFNNQHIDFNRVWKNKQTGDKVLAGIGMLVSGMGSGFSGQPNMAMKVINDEIDRDIAQQKEEGERKRNAFTMYRDMYGDEQRGIQAQRLGMQAVVGARLNQMLSKSMGPMAAAQMLQKSPLVLDMQQKALALAMEKAKFKMMGDLVNQPDQPNQLTTQPQSPGAQPSSPTTPAGYRSASMQESQGQPQSQISLGRTGKVNNRSFTAFQMAGVMPKEDQGEATKEAKAFEEAQTTKGILLNDLMQMTKSVQENRKSANSFSLTEPLGMLHAQKAIHKLPFHIGEALTGEEPWGGEKARSYATAESSALNKINSLLTKRIGGEAMKNIKLQLPDRMDSDEEIQGKIERIMALIDANTATPTLDRYKLIN